MFSLQRMKAKDSDPLLSLLSTDTRNFLLEYGLPEKVYLFQSTVQEGLFLYDPAHVKPSLRDLDFFNRQLIVIGRKPWKITTYDYLVLDTATEQIYFIDAYKICYFNKNVDSLSRFLQTYAEHWRWDDTEIEAMDKNEVLLYMREMYQALYNGFSEIEPDAIKRVNSEGYRCLWRSILQSVRIQGVP